MKRFFAILLCVCMLTALVACDFGATEEETTATQAPATTKAPKEETPEEDEEAVEADYKLGMGIVVSMDSSKTGNAQVDATVATVVTDADGKIVACRIDAAQNKMNVAGGAVNAAATFQTKMEKGNDYNMATWGAEQDNNGDGVVKEWFEQAKAFETWVVGKTAAEVAAMPTQVLDNDFGTAGYVISADEALLAAGCTIQVGDFVEAVVKACEDEQGMSFKAVAGSFTLGVAAKTTAAESVAATADANGTVKMYTDFAATVVADGKIVAALNDAIQPNIAITVNGECTPAVFAGTKRERKEGYNMATWGAEQDNNGDGKVLEWYLQSAEFSKFVVGKTAAEVAAMPTQVLDNDFGTAGYVISADEALLTAGCTIQITAIKAVVAQAVTNAR